MSGGVRGPRGLLAWCRAVLTDYPGLDLLDMSASWRDGRAFCGLVHRFRPDLLAFSLLSASDPAYNCNLAFSIAENFLGIPSLLDAADIVSVKVPDQRSIITYVSLFYHKFHSEERGLVHSLMFTNNMGPEITRENPFIAELEKYSDNRADIHQELADIFRVKGGQPGQPDNKYTGGESSIEGKHWEREPGGRRRTNTSETRPRSLGGSKHTWSRILHQTAGLHKSLMSHFNRIFQIQNVA